MYDVDRVCILPVGFIIGDISQQILVLPISELDFEIRAILQLTCPRSDRAHLDGLDLLFQSLQHVGTLDRRRAHRRCSLLLQNQIKTERRLGLC